MSFSDRFGDGQSDPGPSLVAGTRGVTAIEAFEDVGELFFRHAFAGVTDAQCRCGTRAGAAGHHDLSPRRCVAQCVGQEVPEYLRDAQRVGIDIDVHHVGDEVDGRRVVAHPHLAAGVVRQGAEPLTASIDRYAAFLSAGDVVEVAGQPGQTFGLVFQDLSRSVCGARVPGRRAVDAWSLRHCSAAEPSG